MRAIRRVTSVQRASLLAGALFLAFLMFSAVISSKSKSQGKVFTPSPTEVTTKVESSQLVLQDFFRIMLKRGKKSMEVKASSGKFLPQEAITYLTDAEVKVQRDTGGPVTFRSKNARLFMDGEQVNRADLEGTVVVEFENGPKILSELASYDAQLQQIRIPGAVSISGQGYTVDGDGMEVELDTEIIRIARDVRSKFEGNAKMPSVPLPRSKTRGIGNEK